MKKKKVSPSERGRQTLASNPVIRIHRVFVWIPQDILSIWNPQDSVPFAPSSEYLPRSLGFPATEDPSGHLMVMPFWICFSSRVGQLQSVTPLQCLPLSPHLTPKPF